MMSQENYIGYVGTYTKGASEGIYRFVLNTNKQTIEQIEVAAKVENPTYLSLHTSNQFLYSVAKTGDLGGVASFTIDASTGELTPVNSVGAAGSPPCHLSINTANDLLVTANYHKGTLEAHKVEHGTVTDAFTTAAHTGSGPDPRQEKAHTHFSGFTPDEKYVIAVELGIDKVFSYELVNGELSLVSELATKPGSGPRHIVFHPTKPLAYVMTEFSSEVIVLSYENGTFAELQSIPTIPADFSENNQGSAIHISADGRFVYAGNRGHNSIASYAVGETGELTFLEYTSTEGDWPRDFSLDPSENFLIASNQESSNLVLFARDAQTGKLTLIQSDITVPDPVCVKFLKY